MTKQELETRVEELEQQLEDLKWENVSLEATVENLEFDRKVIANQLGECSQQKDRLLIEKKELSNKIVDLRIAESTLKQVASASEAALDTLFPADILTQREYGAGYERPNVPECRALQHINKLASLHKL